MLVLLRATVAKGPASLRNQMPTILEDAAQNLTPRMRNLLDHLWREWKQLESKARGAPRCSAMRSL